MIVMKFGGTSVANSEAISRSVSIVESKLSERPVVVVSALSGITDLLYKVADAAEKEDKDIAAAHIAEIRRRHLEIVDTLVKDPERHTTATATVNGICDDLTAFVNAVCAVGELTPRGKAKIISNGEWLSSNVICYAMNDRGIPTGFADARTMIITSGSNMKGDPVLSEITRLVPEVVEAAYKGNKAVITQGFISSSTKGDAAVLGRGGSDYSASLIGMAIDAKAIEIWTDVDGVKTADPRRVPNTLSIEQISFEEAAQMAHFGAKVLHPLTIEPAVMKNIPVFVLNSMNPSGKGTAILNDDKIKEGVKSVSFKENILMLNIFSPSMIDVSGYLSRVFAIFAEDGISVDLISTSEANISLTVEGNQNIEKTVARLSEFAKVRVEDDKAQVSIIGKNVVNQRGLVRWAMSSLYDTNIYMISQDASFVNMSFVVDRAALDEVLLDLHRYLFEFQS